MASFSVPEGFEEYMNGQPPDAEIIEQRNMANQTGVFKSSESPKPVICPWCDGRGGKEGAIKKCAGCDGHGIKTMARQMGTMTPTFCPDCIGEGEIISEKDRCKQCNGKKTIVERKVLHNVDRGEYTKPSSAIVTYEKVGARDQELISQHQPRGGSLQQPSTPQVPGTPRPLVTERKSTAIIQARLNKRNSDQGERTEEALRLVSEYPQYRAIARDGDAGWRAIAFSYFEAILKSRKRKGYFVEFNRLESINRAIRASGYFTAWNFNILSMKIETLLQQLNLLLCRTLALGRFDYLSRYVNGASHSAPTIRYFRLLASWCLKQNFQHYRTRKCYCPETELEGCMWLETPGSPMGPLGFTILLDILLIPIGSGLEIVYGDSCISMPIAARDTTGDEHTNAGQTIHLLYWGGHYDILYKDEATIAPIAEGPVPTPFAPSLPQRQEDGNSSTTAGGKQGPPVGLIKWICVKPADDARYPQPIVTLAACESCVGFKNWDTYYEAAAHLRFNHFKPTIGVQVVVPKDRLGLKNDDWPLISQLEPWIKRYYKVSLIDKLRTETPEIHVEFKPDAMGDKELNSEQDTRDQEATMQLQQHQMNLIAAAPINLERFIDDDTVSNNTYQNYDPYPWLCVQCEAEGFRGHEELRKHQQHHKELPTQWVCVDPTGDGLEHPIPTVPLSQCKSCGEQKKYSQNYAAAHLELIHFKPRPLRRDEKLTGMGNNNWLPISELQYWMKAVYEPASEYPLPKAQRDYLGVTDDELISLEPMPRHEAQENVDPASFPPKSGDYVNERQSHLHEFFCMSCPGKFESNTELRSHYSQVHGFLRKGAGVNTPQDFERRPSEPKEIGGQVRHII